MEPWGKEFLHRYQGERLHEVFVVLPKVHAGVFVSSSRILTVRRLALRALHWMGSNEWNISDIAEINSYLSIAFVNVRNLRFKMSK